MATILRKCLPANVLEMISNVLGDTSEGLTGTEIHRFLLQSRIEDVDPTNTKRYRLFNALAIEQNKNKCSNQILKDFFQVYFLLKLIKMLVNCN